MRKGKRRSASSYDGCGAARHVEQRRRRGGRRSVVLGRSRHFPGVEKPMSLAAVLSPLFVEVALTFGLLFWLGELRRRDFVSGAVKAEDIALREPNWPRRTAQVG